MAMNRNMTIAEKEVRDYAQRQMERAEQRENILFTEEQKAQVLEYAAMTGDDYDIRKMVRDLADAVRSSDEEKVNEILWDAREKIDGFPDRSVGMAELKGYGYIADDMFPLRQEMALELHRVGEKVYCLQSDGSHGDYASREMIVEHEGLYGIEKKLYTDDTTDRYFHLYYKSARANAERTQLENLLLRMAETMDKGKGRNIEFGKSYEHYYELTYHEKNGVRKFYGYKEREDVIEKELELCGYFAIVTSERMSAEDALLLYKNRDSSEKLFCSDKSFLGNRSLRVYGNEALESKIFIEFIALIIRSKIYTMLRRRMAEMIKKLNYMTVPAALRELEKIELIRQPGGHYKVDHAITATQKTILGAFGIEEGTILAKAVLLGKELENAFAPETEENENGTYQEYEDD